MACTIEDITEAPGQAQADAVLGDLLINQCGGSTQRFLDLTFDFMARKSNWLKGGDAKQKVLAAFAKASGEPAPQPGLKSGFFAGAGKSTTATAAAAAASAAARSAPQVGPDLGHAPPCMGVDAR